MSVNCTCPDAQNATNFDEVKEDHPVFTELKNASFFYQLHRRTTHSRDAFEAFLCITGLTCLVVISVLISKMWKEKESFEVQQKQQVRYSQQGPNDEILVKGKQRVLFTVHS